MEEYILAVLGEDGRIAVSTTGSKATEAEIAKVRNQLLRKRLIRSNVQAILRRRV